MSGLCGWFSRAAQPAEIEQMALPLAHFDTSPISSAVSPAGAVAIAASPACTHLYREEQLLIAVWGACSPGLPELARLWRSRGAMACAALSGPFALAILDEGQDQALLAVDRSAIHPICFEQRGADLLFASSASALARHPGCSGQIAPQAIYDYLYFHVVPSPGSIYLGQQRLLPGAFLHLRGVRAQQGKYWQIAFAEREPRPFADLKDSMLTLLRSALRQASGAHRIGAFLSGGTDSSTLAGLLESVTGQPTRSYSIGFDAPGYDEMAYARLAARHFNTVHHELYVTPDDVVRAVPQIAAVFDQPFGNASAVPAYYCAQLAGADGVTRMLGGDGGDELFGGNERYARQAVFSRYETIPASLRQKLIEPLLFRCAPARHAALLDKARSYVRQALIPLPARLESYNLLQHYGSANVLDAGFLASCDGAAPLASLCAAYWDTQGHSQINQLLALDMKFTLADNDLPKVSKACELAGLEVAFPFLDDAMVAFASRLPPGHKLNGTQLRFFFKQALRGTLPKAILRKKKHGFGLPFGLWLHCHAGLRQLAYDSLSDLKRRRIVRAEFIDTLLNHHLADHPAYHGTMVWVLMMLEQWFLQHAAPAPLAAPPMRSAHERQPVR